MEMGITGILWVPWDFQLPWEMGKILMGIGRDENGNKCDGNWINIFTMTFPFPSLLFQFSVFMHVRQTC